MPLGAPNVFKPELGRNLSKVFVPDRGYFESPQLVSGIVTLSHDFPGTLPYLSPNLLDSIGANDVTLISSAITPPEGFFWLVDEMSILANNDTPPHSMRVYLTFQTSLGAFSVTVFRVDTAVAANTPYSVGRRFVVTPQTVVNLTISALTAGGNLRFTMVYYQLPAGQFVPKN